MKCCGYDEEFQRHLATMPVGWTRPKDPKKSAKSPSKRNTHRKPEGSETSPEKKSQRLRKSARYADTSSEESDTETGDVLLNESYRHQGTRSRPIHL